MKCENQGCENDAEILDEFDNKICETCMDQEIGEGNAEPEEFERIEDNWLHMKG